jgi:beta-N-acetylglucosaminidase
MNKYISLVLVVLVALNLFSYQSKTAYASDDISGITLETEMRSMIELGILQGYGDNIYKPNDQVTRGQFATFLSRALQLPEGSSAFTDVPITSKLASGINSANAAGIVQGYGGGVFGINDPITREQMALMIDRALLYLNVERNESTLTFTDTSEIGEVFIQAVSRNVYDSIIKGIPNGDGTNRFAPKKTATRAEASAFIYRMINKAKEFIDLAPGEADSGSYKVATIDANKKLVTGSKSYSTFDSAIKTVTNSNQVVTYNDQIVKMSSGLVISRPAVGSSITIIYKDQGFKTQLTYLPSQQEMRYLDSTDQYVKVNIAGMTGYVKHTDAYLVPTQQIEGRSYYSVNTNGDLAHSIYNPMTKSYTAYVVGKAPSFLMRGNQYYSLDGGIFFNAADQLVGTAYQYFNYLPVRVSTSYTAADLDRFINAKLSELEQLYNQNPSAFSRYKNATQLSKIKGLGNDLKTAESQYKINALFILALAMHESDYGLNVLSQERNNLFSIKAYDSNTNEAERYASPKEAIDALASRYLNKSYIYPLGSNANGAVTGNKARGFNVKYASDPYWGQKISGHMYRVDQFLGGKDIGKYRIAETNTTGLNVRNTPGVSSSNLQFTYPKSGMPVAILESVTHTDGSTWHKIMSDSNDYKEGYILSNYATDMNLVK